MKKGDTFLAKVNFLDAHTCEFSVVEFIPKPETVEGWKERYDEAKKKWEEFQSSPDCAPSKPEEFDDTKAGNLNNFWERVYKKINAGTPPFQGISYSDRRTMSCEHTEPKECEHDRCGWLRTSLRSGNKEHNIQKTLTCFDCGTKVKPQPDTITIDGQIYSDKQIRQAMHHLSDVSFDYYGIEALELVLQKVTGGGV